MSINEETRLLLEDYDDDRGLVEDSVSIFSVGGLRSVGPLFDWPRFLWRPAYGLFLSLLVVVSVLYAAPVVGTAVAAVIACYYLVVWIRVKVVSLDYNEGLVTNHIRRGTRGRGRRVGYKSVPMGTSLTSMAVSLLHGQRRTGIFMKDVRAKLLGALNRDGYVTSSGLLVKPNQVSHSEKPRLVASAIREARYDESLVDDNMDLLDDWVEIWVEDYQGRGTFVGPSRIWFWRLEHKIRLFLGCDLLFPSE